MVLVADEEREEMVAVYTVTDWLAGGGSGLRYAFDKIGRMTKHTDYDNSTLDFTYDDNGNVITMNDYHSSETTYTDAMDKTHVKRVTHTKTPSHKGIKNQQKIFVPSCLCVRISPTRSTIQTYTQAN